MIRFALCGCGGFMEKAVIPMMLRVPAARIVAAFDTNPETLDRVCTAFQIPRRCRTFTELLQTEADVIYIASPNRFHKEQAIAAAQHGFHIFCQKPMAMNAGECQEMLEACTQAGVQMGMGFCYRFQGGQQKMRELIASEAVGPISYLYMSFNLGGYNPETAGWRCNASLSGGGPLMDLAPHLIDLALWLLQDEVVSIMAYVQPERTAETIELDADVLLQFAGGARAAINTSFVRGNYHTYTAVGKSGQIRALGTMCWNNEIPGIGMGEVFIEQEMRCEPVAFTTKEHLAEEIRLFCAALESRQPVPVSGQYGLKVQQIIDAIYESGRTGRRVSL